MEFHMLSVLICVEKDLTVLVLILSSMVKIVNYSLMKNILVMALRKKNVSSTITLSNKDTQMNIGCNCLKWVIQMETDSHNLKNSE
jgi:hypothetical protein